MHKIALLASVAAVGFMSEICETVLVTGKDGEYRMNKSDYDAMDEADRPSLASKAKQADNANEPVQTDATPLSAAPGVPVPPAPSAPSFIDAVPPPNPSEDTLSVVTEGKGRNAKFFVVRASTGEKVTDMKDVDANGYDTEALAWAAVMAVKREPALQNVENPPHTPTMPDAGKVEG